MKHGFLLTALAFGALGGGCATSQAARQASSAQLAPGDYVATVNGAALSYHVHGSGPVVIVHPGGPGLTSAYLRIPLLERSFTLVYIDPVGTSASGKLATGGYTLERYASDLEGLRVALGLARPWLLGHSHGGMVALLYASTHPDHLAGLLLYSTAPRIDEEFGRILRAAMASRSGEPWYADAMAADRDWDRAQSDAELTSAVRRWFPFHFADYTSRHAEFDPVIATLDMALAPNLPLPDGPEGSIDLRPRLLGIRVPTLILVGRHDVGCGPQIARELLEGIAGSRIHVFEDSGHMAHVEEATAFAATVRAFVGEAP